MNNPYENNYFGTPEEPENISSSQNPEDTEHVNSETVSQSTPTPDYTPDEYYSKHYGNQSFDADNYARLGENYYNNPQKAYDSQPKYDSQPRYDSHSYDSHSYDSRSYDSRSYDSQPYGSQPYENQTQYNAQPSYSAQPQNPYTSSSYAQRKPKAKKKKEKKPVTRSTVAVVLVVSILCSMLLGFGEAYFVSKFFNSSQSTTDGLTVNKSDSGSPDYKSSNASLSTTQIVEKTANAVVEITTEQVVTGTFNQQYIQKGAGSGVIISKDGYIVTNYHVIEGSSKLTVTLRDKTEYTDVDVIGTYSDGDIALLKIKPKKDLTAATFGDSSKLEVGDYAVVIGNPLGQLGGTVTDGIISALDREVTIDNETMNLLQTNAEISPGNSGGGLFNGNGELIGIVNAKSGSENAEGIGFAIPINDVQDILSDLKQYGYVKGQIDLGMSLSDISSTAQLWMYGASQTGVYVTSVNTDSNAAKAGFRSGDIITKINSTEVKSTTEVNALIKKLKVGDVVTFSVIRNNQSGTIKMKLQEYTKDSATKNAQNNSDNFSDNDSDWNIFG